MSCPFRLDILLQMLAKLHGCQQDNTDLSANNFKLAVNDYIYNNQDSGAADVHSVTFIT